MIWLFLGLLLWFAGHFFKRTLPDMRDGMGDKGKGVAAVIIVAGVVLMVIGYRSWYSDMAYATPVWGIHLNNLLMFVAIFLFGLGSSKSPLRAKMRHPMLTGVIVWAVAHLLVNGDWASVVLFGGLIVWAIAEIAVINRAVPEYTPFEGGSGAGTVRLLVISLVVYAVIAGIHTLLGYWPFPG